MKKVLFVSVLVLLFSGVGAQINTPKLMSIIMVGKSGKPILDIYIVDSTCKGVWTFDVHDIDLYADKKTIQKLFAVFQNEARFDSTIHYDYSFGTFLFSFWSENGEKVKIIANRKQSLLLFDNIIGRLSPDDIDEALIIPEIKNSIARINY
jgi:hypothetical protein